MNQTPPSDPPAVVLVEDDASLLRALTFALEAEGLTVRSYLSLIHIFRFSGLMRAPDAGTKSRWWRRRRAS